MEGRSHSGEVRDSVLRWFLHFTNRALNSGNVERRFRPRVMVWYSTSVVARDLSNPQFLSVNCDAMNEPRNVGRSFPADLLRSHTPPWISNDSRRTNNLKIPNSLPWSNEHTYNFNSETPPARDLKHALSDASLKPRNETAVRVNDLRLVNAERWDPAWRSCPAPKTPCEVVFRASWREVT